MPESVAKQQYSKKINYLKFINSEERNSTMDATNVFNQVIKQVEDSKFNYVIQKTPFSAQISIKRSLIKFHDTPSNNQGHTKVKKESSDVTEVSKLKSDLAAASDKIDKLEETLKKKRLNEEVLNEEVRNLRSDNLKVKRERKLMKEKLDKQENMKKTFEEEKMKIKEEKSKVEQDLKETVEALKDRTGDCKVLQEARTQSEQFLKKL